MSADPKYIGPGYWASWHIKSRLSNNFQTKSETSRGIAIDIDNFPCNNCKIHAKKYVKNNPLIIPVRNNDDPLSLFKWTVNMHNFVNNRLNKPIIDWKKAYDMWGDDAFCIEDDCSGNKKNNSIQKIKINYF